MPKYVWDILKKSKYIKSALQYSPHKHTPVKYGQTQQTAHIDQSLKLDSKETKCIQSIVSSFLYYARVLDYTLFPGINEMSTSQSQPTKDTEAEV